LSGPKAIARAAVVLLTLGGTACASLIGLESVRYDDDDGGDAGDGGGTDAAEASTGDGCPGQPCGARCCDKGAVCMDAGVCSSDVVDVSGGGEASCAVVADGTVWCWGSNEFGQLGTLDAGETCTFINGDASIPVPCGTVPRRIEQLPSAIAVAAGTKSACAVAADRSVWCWGWNQGGVLGHSPANDLPCEDRAELFPDGGELPPVPCKATPQEVEGIGDAAAVAVSYDVACARTTAGAVWCWGHGENGQLGDGAGTTSSTPVQVQGLPDDIVQIANGLYAQAVLAVSRDGGAYAWGDNLIEEPKSLVAHPLSGGGGALLVDVAEVHAGNNFACVRHGDGRVRCWGYNEVSELGRGACDNDGGHPIDSVIGIPAQLAIDGRWTHSCALDAAGMVRCWGLAQDGAMGLGVVTGDKECITNLKSTATPVVVPGLPRITKIATGIETTFAIDENGRLWAWGANDFGRLGHPPKTGGDRFDCGDPSNKTVCNPTPAIVLGLP
jgi:alpha-tubulin suppressor-like RCC1 family protein